MKKTLVTLSIVLVGALSFQSCNQEQKNTKETKGVQEEAQASAEAVTYVADSTSSINWIGSTLAKNHYGKIALKGGELLLNKEGKLESGSFISDMNTIKTGDEGMDEESKTKLDGHLKAEEFFNITKFPESKFTITSVKEIQGDYNSELSGNLELRGVSKNLTVKANTVVDGDKVTLKTEKFTINRQDFGIVYSNGSPADKLIKDAFDLEVSITATKK